MADVENTESLAEPLKVGSTDEVKAKVSDEPLNKSSLQDDKVVSGESLRESSIQDAKPTSDEPLMEGSTQNIKKAEIFGQNVKEDSAPASKVPSLKSIKSYESPKDSKGSMKSHESARGSKSSIKSQGSRIVSKGSIKSHDSTKGSKSSIRSQESARISIDSKNSIKSHESSIKESSSYGSGGPCKIFDSVSLDEPVPQASFSKLQRESVQSHESAKAAVLDVLEVILRKDSKGSIRSDESIPETVTQPPVVPFTPDDEYLKKHLGVPLTHALAEIVIKQPVDPIHYLGHWLFKWRWNQEHKQQKEDEVNALTMARKQIQEEIEEKERIEAEKKAIEEAQRIAQEDAYSAVEYAVERAFYTMDAQSVIDDAMNKVFHTIQEEDPDFEEEARDEFDTHPTDTSAEGTAPPTTDTTEDSDY